MKTIKMIIATLLLLSCEDFTSVRNNKYDPNAVSYYKAPSINLRHGTDNVEQGATVISFTDVMAGSTEVTDTFTIDNTGTDTDDIYLTADPMISISGTDAELFSVTAEPLAAISCGTSSDFTIGFNPSGKGTRSATITIQNNDPEKSTYSFNISANVINLKEIDTNDSLTYYTTSARAIDNMIFVSYYNTGNGDLMMAKSSDRGNTWSLITVDNSSNDVGEHSSIAVARSSDAGKYDIMISYYDKTATRLKIARSMDSGANWSIKTLTSGTDAIGQYSSISMFQHDHSEVVASCWDVASPNKLLVYYTNDFGTNWVARNLPATTDNYGRYSFIAAGSPDRVYACYYNTTGTRVQCAVTANISNASPTWNIYNVDTSVAPSGYSLLAAVAVPDANGDDTTGDDIFISMYHTGATVECAKSTDGGATWGVKAVPSSGNATLCNAIAVEGSNVYIAYGDSNLKDLLFTRSSDYGETFSVPQPVAVVNSDSLYPGTRTAALAINGSSVYCTFFRYYALSPLVVSKSIDNGDTW